MENAFAFGNSRALYRLIHSTGPRKASVSELITERDGSIIFSQKRRLERWNEYFGEQFNWPPASQPLQGTIGPTWDVDVTAPSEVEVYRAISHLKRDKAAGPDRVHPALIKEGGTELVSSLTRLFQRIWNEENTPKEWNESTVIPIFKKGARTQCENHRGISLVAVVSKVLSSIILRRLSSYREKQTRENQGGFRPGRGCIDQIFTLRQTLELRHTYRRPTMVIFLDLKGAFDSVDRHSLLQCLAMKGVPPKFLQLVKALYVNTRGRVRAYGKLSSEFTTTSGVRQGCPLSPFLFNFVIDVILEMSIPTSDAEGVELLPGCPLIDLEYADDIVLLGADPSKMQALLDKLQTATKQFGMSFAPAKCKVLFQDWVGSKPSMVISGQPLEVVEEFTYLGSRICPGGSIKSEISSRIGKARAAFANLRHLWRRPDVSLTIKGRVYNAAVRSTLLYASESWPIRAEDIHKLSVFDHRCLRSIARVWWEHRISNAEVRRMVFGANARSIEEVVTLHRLRWLGHVLRMPDERLPKRALFAQPCSWWKRQQGGQHMTWQRSMKTVTSKLSRVGNCRLPGWGPKDLSHRWLETLAEMAQSRSQWRMCIRAIASNA